MNSMNLSSVCMKGTERLICTLTTCPLKKGEKRLRWEDGCCWAGQCTSEGQMFKVASGIWAEWFTTLGEKKLAQTFSTDKDTFLKREMTNTNEGFAAHNDLLTFYRKKEKRKGKERGKGRKEERKGEKEKKKKKKKKRRKKKESHCSL